MASPTVLSIASNTPLPRWDMSVVFRGLDSPQFHLEFENVEGAIGNLESKFNELDIDKDRISSTPGETFDSIVPLVNSVQERLRTLNAYISAFVSTNTRDERALAKDSEMELQLVRSRKLAKRLTGWLGSQDLTALKSGSHHAAEYSYVLEKAIVSSNHMMSPNEEALASDLETTGRGAWAKLHDVLTSQLSCVVDGEAMPISAVRSLAHEADRDKRRAAYDAELSAWKTVEAPLAAAMNCIKGETALLCKNRGWGSALDEALLGANIDRETLDAMMLAANESFPVFRRYLHAKARALRIEKLAWFDMFAPLGESPNSWDYPQAMEFVEKQFRNFSDRLADFAKRSFAENWIDAPSTPGKVDGAFCMGLRRDESRILMNYKPSFGSVSTLAHELGHAYHNRCLSGRTALQRATPMTLAETASIFCETIIREAVLKNGTPDEQLVVLEASLQGTCQVVVDIASRYRFETAVFTGRAKRELSSTELCTMMLEAQMETYGEGLDSSLLHPYMWAVKGHYYSPRSYYNFPYMFGLLFGLGLYSVYEREPAGFQERYDDLLSSTGMADAATLANQFGINIRTPDFWRGSLDQIRADVDRFELLI